MIDSRQCPICSARLVQREGEADQNFRTRRTCAEPECVKRWREHRSASAGRARSAARYDPPRPIRAPVENLSGQAFAHNVVSRAYGRVGLPAPEVVPSRSSVA